MPAATRLQILKWSFCLYAVLSLVSMATMGIGAALLLVGILVTSPSFQSLNQEIVTEGRRVASKRYLILSIALISAAVLSLIGGSFFPLSYGGKFSQVHFLKDLAKIWYFFWPLVMVIGIRRLPVDARKTVFYTWLAAFGALSALGALQHYIGWPREQPIPGDHHYFHTTLFLGHHLSVASIFIFPFFASLDSALHATGRKRVWFTIAAILGFFTLWFTYSRTLWIALPVGIVLWLIWSLPKKWGMLCTTVILILGLGLSQYPPVKRRMLDQLGVGPRQELWNANMEFFKQRPLTGVGWRHNQELSGYYLMERTGSDRVFSGHAHNNLLEMLSGTGILGTLSWILWCLGAIWLLLRKRDKAAMTLVFTKGLVCAWLVFHVNGMTQVNFWEGKVEHQIAWVIAWSLL